jgi:hypothetical protein
VRKVFRKAGALSLAQAMRSFGAVGEVKGQRIRFIGGNTLMITRSRKWALVNEAFGDVADSRTAVCFSAAVTNDVRVMMSIEHYATLIGQIDRLSIEAGRTEE